LRTLATNGIKPHVIKKDGILLLLDLPNLNIRFLDLQRHLNSSIPELAQILSFQQEYKYFPSKFHTFDHIGAIPDMKYFEQFSDSLEILEEKRKYHESFKQEWSFSSQVRDHCFEKANILALSALKYKDEMFLLQQTLIKHLKPDKKPEKQEQPLLHVLSFPFVSQSGFIFECWKLFSNKGHLVKAMPKECTGLKSGNISKTEHEYLSYLQYKGRKLRTAFNNIHGQVINNSF